MRCFLLLSGIDFHAEDEGVDKQGSGEPGCFGIAIRARVKWREPRKDWRRREGGLERSVEEGFLLLFFWRNLESEMRASEMGDGGFGELVLSANLRACLKGLRLGMSMRRGLSSAIFGIRGQSERIYHI